MKSIRIFSLVAASAISSVFIGLNTEAVARGMQTELLPNASGEFVACGGGGGGGGGNGAKKRAAKKAMQEELKKMIEEMKNKD